jgi:hypothetical protein
MEPMGAGDVGGDLGDLGHDVADRLEDGAETPPAIQIGAVAVNARQLQGHLTRSARGEREVTLGDSTLRVRFPACVMSSATQRGWSLSAP